MSRSIHETIASARRHPKDSDDFNAAVEQLAEKRRRKRRVQEGRALLKAGIGKPMRAEVADTPSAPISSDYPTCEATYSTLRIFTGSNVPDLVSTILGFPPTTMLRAADGNPRNAWLFSTEKLVDSPDVRVHIDFILNKLKGKSRRIHDLQAAGYSIDVFCYWVSRSGHGGPMLSASQMRRLASLDLNVGFDVYFQTPTTPSGIEPGA